MLMKQMMLLCGGDCDSDGGTDMVLQTLLTLVALVPTTLVPVLLSLPALVSGLGSLQRLVSRLLELTMVSRLLELTLGSALTTLRSPLALVHLTPVLLPLVRTLVTKTLRSCCWVSWRWFGRRRWRAVRWCRWPCRSSCARRGCCCGCCGGR
jgi:hypothetical protein